MLLNLFFEQSIADTIQSRARQDAEAGIGGGRVFLVDWLAHGSSLAPSWWSRSRDTYMRAFWRGCDYLASSVYTIEAKMAAIPFKIVARDTSVHEHVSQAEQLTQLMIGGAEFGEGWAAFYAKWVEDLVTIDNGAYAEIIGPGDPSGPIMGAPVGIAHLDGCRCTRTGNAVYPVIYDDIDGRRYKIHYTRVIYASQMASPVAEMYGVGYSAVSRCASIAQTLIDVITFKQEKMGSRPHRAILVPQGGLDPKDVSIAFSMAEAEMDNQGLSRYSKVVVAGSSSIPEADIKIIELSTLPDGFDEETNTTMGMSAIALAFGMDARELWPAMPSSATRADAMLQHLKQRGKGPGQILQTTESQFDHKYLPPHLQMVFDFQDDAQDRQVADIRRVRAERRQIDMNTGALDIRTMREQMLADGDIDRGQFEMMELRDGRLDNGASVLSLFYSKDPNIAPMLALSNTKAKTSPLDIANNDAETMLTAISAQLELVHATLITARTDSTRRGCFKAVAALTKLYEKYNEYNNSITSASNSAFIDNTTDTFAQLPAKPVDPGSHPTDTNPTHRTQRRRTPMDSNTSPEVKRNTQQEQDGNTNTNE